MAPAMSTKTAATKARLAARAARAENLHVLRMKAKTNTKPSLTAHRRSGTLAIPVVSVVQSKPSLETLVQETSEFLTIFDGPTAPEESHLIIDSACSEYSEETLVEESPVLADPLPAQQSFSRKESIRPVKEVHWEFDENTYSEVVYFEVEDGRLQDRGWPLSSVPHVPGDLRWETTHDNKGMLYKEDGFFTPPPAPKEEHVLSGCPYCRHNSIEFLWKEGFAMSLPDCEDLSIEDPIELYELETILYQQRKKANLVFQCESCADDDW